MRLIGIKPTYFRAFGDSNWISLNSNLVVIYGPNGFGKTSISEALEWLLYGKTRRRERGEALSQREHQGSYRNVHAPAGHPTSVEAKLKATNGTEYQIKRELQIGARNVETSVTFIDAAPADFSTIGLSTDELYKPVIAQDSLHEIIHAKPKERRDKISAALGLEPLVRFKTAADKARTRLQASPPDSVSVAKGQLTTIIRAMNQNQQVQTMGQRWSVANFDVESDERELRGAAAQILRVAVEDEVDFVSELTRHRAETARRVFDDVPIRIPLNLNNDVIQFESKRAAIEDRVNSLSTALSNFLGATATRYSELQLQFWQKGLELQNQQRPDACPMCEAEDTFTQEKRAEIQQRISQSSDYTLANRALQNESHATAQFISEFATDASLLFPTFLDHDRRPPLLTLFGADSDLCETFLNQHDAVHAAHNLEQELLANLSLQIETLPALVKNPATARMAAEIVARLQSDLESVADQIRAQSDQYEDAYASFSPKLASKVSSADTVRNIDGILSPLTGWQHVQTMAQFHALLAETLLLVQKIEAHIQAKQAELFAARGQEIKTWYDTMNPGASVRYAGMEPGTDNLVLWAESFGVPLNAAACLSQCQLNCLGLSIHLFRGLTPGSPFAFLLIDDPVQAMDDDHCQALILQVLNNLLARGLQLVICSHVQGVVDSIWETYYAGQPLRLRISEFQQTGPVIEEAETLRQAVQRSQALAAGNEDNRRLAVKVVRRCVELLVRSVCRHTNSASPSYDSTASNMLPFFRACPGTSVAQAQGINQTIGFSNPGPHTQVGWAVPVEANITPHIDRIRQTAQQLGVW
jgi:energy-coupling factor transporter ATP-binding protein EcfA2